MEASNTNYQQVTVDVPEDRIAEFHAFFARFLAGRGRRGGHRHHGRGRRCGEHRGQTETPQQSETTEV
jgi:hypothetical protein